MDRFSYDGAPSLKKLTLPRRERCQVDAEDLRVLVCGMDFGITKTLWEVRKFSNETF